MIVGLQGIISKISLCEGSWYWNKCYILRLKVNQKRSRTWATQGLYLDLSVANLYIQLHFVAKEYFLLLKRSFALVRLSGVRLQRKIDLVVRIVMQILHKNFPFGK